MAYGMVGIVWFTCRACTCTEHIGCGYMETMLPPLPPQWQPLQKVQYTPARWTAPDGEADAGGVWELGTLQTGPGPNGPAAYITAVRTHSFFFFFFFTFSSPHPSRKKSPSFCLRHRRPAPAQSSPALAGAFTTHPHKSIELRESVCACIHNKVNENSFQSLCCGETRG